MARATRTLKQVQKPAVQDPPASPFQTVEETQIHGRHVRKGTQLSIKGLRGRATFLRLVIRPDGREWVDVVHNARWRSFRLDAITTVHQKEK